MQLNRVLDREEIRRAVTRIAHEILERNHGGENLGLVGILRRGAPLAERLAGVIEKVEGVRPPVGRLDITLYRDDYPERQPAAERSDVPFDVTGKQIVLIDDVIFTGRSVRAAITALMDLGRPAEIQFAALLDRGHRELPIRPDYVGKNVPTSLSQHVECRLVEVDGEDAVYLQEGES